MFNAFMPVQENYKIQSYLFIQNANNVFYYPTKNKYIFKFIAYL